MKKVVYSLLALAASTLVFSCIKNTAEEPVVNSQAEKFITVTCTINTPAPDSKVTLTKEDGKGKTKWEEGDEVFFHGAFVGTSGDDVYSYVATAHDVSADGKSASFTIPAIAKRFNHDEISWRGEKYKTDLYAVYPASAVADFENGDEWYFISAFKKTNHLLLAGCNDTRVDDGMTFEFMNLTGALSFVVSDDGITGGFDAYSISGNNGETVGYTNYCVKMDINGETDSKDYRTLYVGSDGPGPSSGELTTILVEDWNGANGTTVNTVYFPNGVNFSAGFTIKFFKDGNEIRRVSTSTATDIAVGKWLDLKDITSHMYTYTPPATHNSTIGCPADDSDYNLSKSSSANCYIVDGSVSANAEKVFKFKAYQGNSTTNVGTIDSAVLLWETWNDAEAVTENSVIYAVDYDKQAANDYYEICFKMPSTLHEGNALIAAKDAMGNILWSWHIWVPATTIESIDNGIHTVAMMDRNLGALRATVASNEAKIDVTSMGMWYQWGRKDPFPGPSSIDTPDAYPGFATVAGTNPTRDGDAQFTIAESIKNPTVMVGNDTDKKDWLSVSDGTLWGDASSKSRFDPCPIGYRVPNRDKKKPLWDGKMNEATGWAYNKDNYWFTVGDPVSVFPCAGYCNGGTAKTTFRTVLWNAHHDGDSPETAYNIYVYYSSETVKFGNYGHNKHRGNYVRCCLE